MKTNSFSNKTNSSFKVILFFNTAPVTMAYKNMEFIYYFIIQQNLCIVDSTDSVVPIYMYAIAIETNNEQWTFAKNDIILTEKKLFKYINILYLKKKNK